MAAGELERGAAPRSWLVVGLGNPGARYAETRHNVGFMVAEALVRTLGPAPFVPRFAGRLAEAQLGEVHIWALEPLTYMNESGRSVRAAAAALGIDPASMLVVHDELDLPLGTLRLKRGGGSAGHRGLASISAELGSSEYGRLRVGIGRPPPNFAGGVADFVLEAFPLTDQATLSGVVERAVEAIRFLVEAGMDEAMNRVNQRVPR